MQKADEIDMVPMVHKVFHFEANDKEATTFMSIYRVPGNDLETLHKITLNPHRKLGSVILILLIKQKPRLSELTKLAQGYADSK